MTLLHRLALAFACVAAVQAASAQTTWWVDGSAEALSGEGSAARPFARIQQGVDAAIDGDSVRVAPGTYVENLLVDGKSIDIASTAGAGATVLQGAGSGSVVVLAHGYPVLDGFTIEGGSGTWMFGRSYGGGVLVFDTAGATIRNCDVRNNYAENGGGIGAYLFAHAIIDGCTIEQNVAMPYPSGCWPGSGGGVFGTNVSIVASDIHHNESGQDGGGVSGCYVESCNVEDNSAARGAGLYDCRGRWVNIRHNIGTNCEAGIAVGGGASHSTLEDCFLIENQTYDNGGGAQYCDLVRCQVIGNRVTSPIFFTEGGGAFWGSAVDCWFEDNWLAGTNWGEYPSYGGGMTGGNALRCVFIGNEADVGAGVVGTTLDRCDVLLNVGNGVESTEVRNSIVRENSAAELVDPTSVAYCDVEGGWPGVGNIDLDPRFWDLPHRDVRLTADSPCIDAGDPAVTDPDGSRADMGAFPYSPNDCLPAVSYCTGAQSADLECTPTIALIGTPSVSATSGCLLETTDIPAARMGVVFFGVSGEQDLPWGPTSARCVHPPLVRTGVHDSAGTPGTCEGVLHVDLNAWLDAHGDPFAVGTILWAQAWYRDPTATFGTNFSSAVRASLCP